MGQDIIKFHREKAAAFKKERKRKKVLTDKTTHDSMSELRLKRRNRTLTNKQQCNPEDSKKRKFRETT